MDKPKLMILDLPPINFPIATFFAVPPQSELTRVTVDGVTTITVKGNCYEAACSPWPGIPIRLEFEACFRGLADMMENHFVKPSSAYQPD